MRNRETAAQMGRMLLKRDYLGAQGKARMILSSEGMFYTWSIFLHSTSLLSFMILVMWACCILRKSLL